MSSLGAEEILTCIGAFLTAHTGTWPSKGAGPWLSPVCDHTPYGPWMDVLLAVMICSKCPSDQFGEMSFLSYGVQQAWRPLGHGEHWGCALLP